MQESYEGEVATHIGPESCGAARKGGVEALTGERAGRVFSRVRDLVRDADAVRRSGRRDRVHRNRKVEVLRRFWRTSIFITYSTCGSKNGVRSARTAM